MNEITRRRFIEAASLAVAAQPLAGAAQNAGQAPAPTRATASRATSRARDLTDGELEAMFRRCSNTGKWGPNDELGTLNYITRAKRVAAAQPIPARAGQSIYDERHDRRSRPGKHQRAAPEALDRDVIEPRLAAEFGPVDDDRRSQQQRERQRRRDAELDKPRERLPVERPQRPHAVVHERR